MSEFFAQSAGRAGLLANATLRVAWLCVRYSILAILLVAEPAVTFVLTGLSLSGFAAIVIFKGIAHSPSFPTLGMLMFSGGLAALLILYRSLLLLLQAAKN